MRIEGPVPTAVLAVETATPELLELIDPERKAKLMISGERAAALNLAQAGYREDARAQFQWLLKHATDPAQLEIVKRELAKP